MGLYATEDGKLPEGETDEIVHPYGVDLYADEVTEGFDRSDGTIDTEPFRNAAKAIQEDDPTDTFRPEVVVEEKDWDKHLRAIAEEANNYCIDWAAFIAGMIKLAKSDPGRMAALKRSLNARRPGCVRHDATKDVDFVNVKDYNDMVVRLEF